MEEMPPDEYEEWKFAATRNEIPTEQQKYGMVAATMANFGGLVRPEKPVGWKDFWPEPKPQESEREKAIKVGENLAARHEPRRKPKDETDELVWNTA